VASDLLAPGALAGADVVVEDTPGSEGGALAELLRAEGARVRLATPAELDLQPRATAAFLDAWTPEVAPRVQALRRNGALVTCLADLVLARSGVPVVGVTGTAGKTTTTAYVIQLLRAAGLAVRAPAPGVSGNLWPDAGLLGDAKPADVAVVELTSSHLAFCSHGPRVAVVTSFWPDHLEWHGSFERYARAKETIARTLPPGGTLVVPADGSCERFVAAAPQADVVRFSLDRPVERGAFVARGRVRLRLDAGTEVDAGRADRLPAGGRCVANVLAAACAALAAGASAGAVAQALSGLETPVHRVREVARVAGAPVVDASMAGTPAKAAAVLEPYEDGSVVLVAGGDAESAAGPVHATPEEQELLAAACDVAARKARAVVVFGPAARQLADRLPGTVVAADLDEALALAAGLAAGAAAVVVAPMFPLAPEVRATVPELARRHARGRP